MESDTLFNIYTPYVAKIPDGNGLIHYLPEEHNIWKALLNQQMKIVSYSACDAYLKGIEILNFPKSRIPQCWEISEVLKQRTHWSIEPVSGFMSDKEFFKLLTQKKFPAATFIRRWDEIDHLKEPDIFHEFFGHCPMLIDPDCANFIQHFGEISLSANPAEINYLARLYWFTFETGLIQTSKGLKIYGGAILSSKNEAVYALENKNVIHKPFDLIEVFRTSYRFDILQPVYFVIKDFSELYELITVDLLEKIREAKALGDYRAVQF